MTHRELLLEIGCEELPAAWLRGLSGQLAERLEAALGDARIDRQGPARTFATPRRLVAVVDGVATQQAAMEERVMGPPVRAAFGSDGRPTAAAVGFARKQGVEVAALVRVETPKGEYVAVEKRQRGARTARVLPDVLAEVLRGLSFPKQMHWDAVLPDGRGELLFGRPIRWIVFLLGGRVVPFVIERADAAASARVAPIRSGAYTFGHRFLSSTGRAGRRLRVTGFEDFHRGLAERFVILDRGERQATIGRQIDERARELGGAVDLTDPRLSDLFDEVPDLVEAPSVVAGTFGAEFLTLPAEVLTTSMIHHQHFFPMVDADRRLLPAFLAVTNTAPRNAATVARNAGRVLTARLRDATFFWDADRAVPLASRLERLDTVLFHKALGSYRLKADRLAVLAGRLAGEVFDQPAAVAPAELAGRLAKSDLATEMVGEFRGWQGVMGGVYAREDGHPAAIWQAIYHHYLPIGVEADAPPTAAALGDAAVTWAAVALADKLDTLVGLLGAGERPTGSRDPFGLRRQANGAIRILADLPALTGLTARPSLGELIALVDDRLGVEAAGEPLRQLLRERVRFLLEQRGHDVRNVRAVTHGEVLELRPVELIRKLDALPEFTDSPEFQQLATAFKRVRNIARELTDSAYDLAEAREPDLAARLSDPAERQLLTEIDARAPIIERVLARGDAYREGFAEAAKFGPSVDRFFTEVFVMVEDHALRQARLRLMKRLERVILRLADVSEIVPEA